MKKFSTCLMVLFVIGLMAGSAFAQSYCQDYLEAGNPGGRTTGLKTCDTVNPETLNPGDTFSIDIWAAEIPEPIISSGIEMFYDPAQVSLVSVEAYDGVDIAGGPWDGTATLKIPDAYGPGSYVLAVVQLGTCPVPDAGGDIIIAKVTFQCTANGTGNISVKGIDGFDTTVGCTSGVVYDTTMGTNVLAVTQGTTPTCNPADCDDGNVCTTEECINNVCVNTPNTNPCDDGNACTTGDICSGGSCVGGPALVCNDGNICTDDSCNPASGCVYTNNTAPCDDGNACTTGDTCSGGSCVGGPALNCDDGNVCTDDSCNPASGCVYTNNTAPCDDSLYCNGPDTCSGGSCTVHGGDPCVPPQICNETTDTCEILGCTTNEECDDGLYCNGLETCNTSSGNCVAGTPVDCSDGVDCTTDSCNEGTNSCDNIPNNVFCSDELYCNGAEICDPVLDCQAGTPVNCPDDGLFCSGTEYCDEDTDSCQSSGNPCAGGTVCNEETDTCDMAGECGNGTIDSGEDCDPPGECCGMDCKWAPAGTPCPDTSYCNGMETCNATGVCLPDMPVNCADGINCTDDSCNEALDICEHIPNDANCPDDDLYCNGMEVCDPINGCVSTGDPCPAGTVCNEDDDTCDPVSGITVSVDIKPGSCPNPLNVKSRGVLPVAVLGTKNFDVKSIDPASIRLSRQGVMGEVAPIRWSYEDVGTPFTGELCGCHEKTYDGYMDLTLKFKTQELVEMLDLDMIGGLIPLTLTGNLMDGTEISGKDCIRVQGACKGDFDCDGDVDGKDANKLKINFGWRGAADDSENVAGDFDDDGDIDATDVNGFLTIFGTKYNGTCGFIECKGDFDCDLDVDGTDSKRFKNNFGRTALYQPCTIDNPCNGDFDADGDCDGTDASGFKSDFGRGLFQNPCRGCVEQ